jgi:Arc/MetJ-type ribon-helix-helix transcriptional regulator
MTVEIPVDYCPVVARLISEGRFRDEGEIVAEGLRLVLLRENLDADIQAGIDDLDAGNRIEASEAFAEVRGRIKAIESQKSRS